MDLNKAAFRIVQSLTTESKESTTRSEAGRAGGQVGGRARAAALSPERRKAIAQKANQARWRKNGNGGND